MQLLVDIFFVLCGIIAVVFIIRVTFYLLSDHEPDLPEPIKRLYRGKDER
jgi:hypothetical protein